MKRKYLTFAKKIRGQESNWVFWWGGGNDDDEEDAGCDWESHWVLFYSFSFSRRAKQVRTRQKTRLIQRVAVTQMCDLSVRKWMWLIHWKVRVIFLWHWVQDFISSIAWSWVQNLRFFQWKTSKRESFVAFSCCLWVINDTAKTDGNDQQKQSKKEKSFWQVLENVNDVP